jgi:hypothetical protein
MEMGLTHFDCHCPKRDFSIQDPKITEAFQILTQKCSKTHQLPGKISIIAIDTKVIINFMPV